jgi:hypothetical protein
MDTWMGDDEIPITLNKYAYGDLDPINGIDPSGNMTLGQVATAGGILGILSTTAVPSLNPFKFSSNSIAAGGSLELTDYQYGLLTLLTFSSSPKLYSMVMWAEESNDSPESDKEDIDAINASTITGVGDGNYRVITKCHVKKGYRSIGFVEGEGYGNTLPAAVTNAQASANSRCVRGTQARHCKARQCWRGSTPIRCPRGNN